MKPITIEMPMVQNCGVSRCAYNAEGACHAKAITIGDAVTPDCDTFCPSSSHIRQQTITAGVGACKVTGCVHNQDFACTAESIRVGIQGDHVRCLTFRAR